MTTERGPAALRFLADDPPRRRKPAPPNPWDEAAVGAYALELMSESLLSRLRGEAPSGEASAYSGVSLAGLQILTRPAGAGVASLAMGTGDFPWVLGDALHKRVQDYYRAGPSTARLLSRRVSMTSFREHRLLNPGSFPPLRQVAEHGTITEGFLEEAGEPLTLAKFGRILPITREAIINDDAGALDELAASIAEAAIALEDDLLFASLLSGAGQNGPTLRDGVQLFNAAHGNLAAPAALDAAPLSDAMALLRRQTAPGGLRLNLEPALLVVTPEDEATARRLAREVASPDTPPLRVVPDPHISDASWYVAADPQRRPAYARGTLFDAEEPEVTTEEDFVTGGVRVRAMHRVAVGVVDHRGIVRTPSP